MSHWRKNSWAAHMGRLRWRADAIENRSTDLPAQAAMIHALTELAWEETNKSVGLDSRTVNDFGLKHSEVEWKRK